MWHEPAFLHLCELIARAQEATVVPRAGLRLSRGFADVGYEEFVVLPNGKLMSLFTGQQSEFSSDHRGFFFEVLTIERLIELLSQNGDGPNQGVTPPQARLDETGRWIVSAIGENHREHRHHDLGYALAQALLTQLDPRRAEELT